MSVTEESAAYGKSLRSMVRKGDITEAQVFATLCGLIQSTVDFFNLSRPMSEAQILETAALILEQYPHESMEDFVVTFRNAKLGRYGEIFNRVDGQVIFGWIKARMAEKAAILERFHEASKRQSRKQDENDVKMIENAPKSTEYVLEKSDPIRALKISIGADPDKPLREQEEESFQKFKNDYIKGKQK